MKFEIKNPFTRKNIGIIAFALFCISFMYRSLILAVTSGTILYLIYIFVLGSMLIAVSNSNCIKINQKLLKIYSSWIAFVIIFVLLNSQLFVHHDYGTTIVWLYYFSMILLLPLCPKEWYGIFFKILIILSLIDVLAVYFFMIFKDKYSIMYNIFHEWPTGTDKGTAGYRAGLTAHYSHNAMLIVIGLIAFASLFIVNQNKLKKLDGKKIIVCLLLVMAALILTTKRAHFLFGLIATLWGYIIYNPKKRKENVVKTILIGIAIVAVFVVLANFVPFVNNLYERFTTAGEDSESMSRFTFWKLAFSNFLQSPLFGIGWGGYQFEYHEHLYVKNLYGVDYPYLQAHNVYIQLLCECGILGTLLFLGCAGYAYKKTTNLFTNKLLKYTKDYEISVFSIILQTFFFLYCLTGNCLYDMMFAFYTIAVGFAIGLYIQS